MKAAEKVRTDYVRFGEVRPGWVGVNVVESEQPIHDSTVVIQSFADGSPGADSGLQPGDVLVRIGSLAIHSPPDVLNASFFLTADEDVPITVLRDGKEISVTVTSSRASRPTSSKSFPFLPPRIAKIRSDSGTAIDRPGRTGIAAGSKSISWLVVRFLVQILLAES